MLNMFIFLMIKDTLLPTVQKTHIGKYRTFPDNLQTAEKELASTCERCRGRGSGGRGAGGKVQRELGTADDDLSNKGAKRVTRQRYCGRKKDTIVYHMERGTNSLLNVFFCSFFRFKSIFLLV